MTDLSPASQKLLREIAKYDTGNGVQFGHEPRNRYSHPNTLSVYNIRTFYPLTGQGLVDDGGNDSAPVRITEAGRKAAAELESQQAAKKARPTPSAEGQAARRLLREIAKHDKPTLIYSDSRGPRVWRLGRHDGYCAAVDTWTALRRAGLIHVEQSFAGGQRVSITDAGRQRLAGTGAQR